MRCNAGMPSVLSVLIAATAVNFGAVVQPPASLRPKAQASATSLTTIRLAIDATKQRDFKRAERLYLSVLAKEPKNVAAQANLGLVYVQLGRIPDAINALRKASSLEPDQPEFSGQAALIALKANRFADAIQDARAALRIAPNHRPALLALGAALLAQRKPMDAIPPLKLLYETGRGTDTESAIRYAIALSSTGQLQQALTVVRTQVGKSPKVASLQVMRGDISGQLGFDKKDKDLLTEARNAYLAAYKLSPAMTRAGVNAGLSAEMAGAPLDAKALYQQVLKKAPNIAAARHGLGRCLLQDPTLSEIERIRQARIELEKAVALEPKQPEYLTTLAYSYLYPAAPEFTKAAQTFKAALSLRPDDVRARMGFIDALWRSDQRDAAVVQQVSLVKSIPSDWDAAHRLAAMYQTLGKRQAYLDQLGSMETAFPKDVRAAKELGIALEQDGQFDKAVNVLGSAMKRVPADADMHVTLGLVLEKQGKQNDAKAQYVAAIGLDPKLVAANQALLSLLDRDPAPDAGLAQRRKWLAADPTSNDARWSLIQQLIRLKNDDEALTEIAKLTLRAGDSMRSTYRFAAAGLYEQRDRWPDAVKDLQSIWSTEPSDSLAQRLAYALERNGQAPDAERLLKTQLTKAKEKGLLTLAIAGLYERTKRFGEASTIYEDIITADPGIKVAFDGLARTRKAAGEPTKLVDFIRTLFLGPSTAPPPALVLSTERALFEQSLSAEWTALITAAAEKFKLDTGIQKTYARNLTRPGATPEQKRLAVTVLTAAAVTAPQDDDVWFQLGRLQQELGDKPAAIKAYREAVKRKPNGPARSALLALGEKVD